MERGAIEVVLCKRDKNGNKLNEKERFNTKNAEWLAKRCEQVATRGATSRKKARKEFYGD